MKNELFPAMLARALVKKTGQIFLSLPEKITTEQVDKLLSYANEFAGDDQYAFHVTTLPIEGFSVVSPRTAARYRTRVDGKEVGALIISREGEFKDIDTLNTFRHVNTGSLPGGVAGIEGAELSLGELVKALVDEIQSSFIKKYEVELSGAELEALALGFSSLFCYLGEAYKGFGNSDLSWKDAWWLHVEFLTGRLHLVFEKVYLNDTQNNQGWVQGLIYTAAGMPMPMGDEGYESKNSPDRYQGLVNEKWKTGDGAAWAIIEMERIAVSHERLTNDEAYLLSTLTKSWASDYDSTIAAVGHPILALSQHDMNCPKHILAWNNTLEDEFFEEMERELISGLYRLEGENLHHLQDISSLEPSPAIITRPLIEFTEDGKFLDLGELAVRLEGLESALGVEEFELKAAPISLLCSDAQVKNIEEGCSLITFRLLLRMPISGKGNWREKPYKLVINPVLSDSVNVSLTSSIEFELLIPFPGETSFYLVSKSADKKKSKRIDLQTREYKYEKSSGDLKLLDEGFDRSCKVKGDIGFVDVFVVGGDSDEINLNGNPKKKEMIQSGILNIGSLANERVTDGLVLSDGDTDLTLLVEEDGARPLSPILASAEKSLPSVDEDGSVVESMKADVRGYLESNWLVPVINSERLSGLTQSILLLNKDKKPDELVYDDTIGFFVDGQAMPNFPQVPRALLDHELVSAFNEAFLDLGLQQVAVDFDGNTSAWPSRLSLVGFDKKKVEAYFSAYVNLVKAAKSDGSFKWAVYPFSVILFDSEQGAIKGAFLSPLHPIRFVWNWSIQNAADAACDELLGDGIDVTKLLKFVSGSDLPNSMPIPVGSGTMVSQYLDPGFSDLFVTWSFLADVNEVNAGNAMPGKVCGFKFPSSPVSGLDKGGVIAAINDYLRIYPFTSELKLSIFSQSKIHRSSDLDNAIVSELENILKNRVRQLPGGIRVYDSTNRLGEIPDKEEIISRLNLVLDSLNSKSESSTWDFPFEWKRTGDQPDSDIRFLENSLVNTQYSQTNGQGNLLASGAIPELPLTRFFSWTNQEVGGQTRSGYNPTFSVGQQSAFSQFIETLNDLESWDGQIETWSHIRQGQALHDNAANWIISGNAKLDPWLLSNALKESNALDKVLWEWRPPYIPRKWQDKHSSIMGGMPYTVIAGLGGDFKGQVFKEIEASLGISPEVVFEELFVELGSRGVGIASLLSMGHNQSRGALGFYLGFKLAASWEREAEDREIRMVLPLDAVNQIFETLTGEFTPDDRKKADLLLVSVKTGSSGGFTVRFHPVEIKMHASSDKEHDFPGQNDSNVKSALKQLKSSSKLLNSFVARMNNKKRPVLVNTVLASLFQTGLSLTRNGRSGDGTEQDFLYSVASGLCEFELATGMLFWFEKNGKGHGGAPYLVRKPLNEGDDVGKIFLDPSKCLDKISNPDFEVVQKLVAILDGVQPSLVKSKKKDGAPVQAESAPQEELLEEEAVSSEDVSESDTGDDPENEEHIKVEPEASDNEVNGYQIEGVIAEEILRERYEGIISTLAAHGIDVLMPDNVEPFIEGPASVIYKFRLSPGTDPRKIFSKSDVLHLYLQLTKDQNLLIYIDSGCIVIDVPKKQTERYFINTSRLWEMWSRPERGLAVPLGIDQDKDIVDIDFSSSNSPHLLIGGTTGSGKSEALNTILYGLTHFYNPEELRLVLVDPKGTEMTDFEASPFLHGEIGWDDESAVEQLDEAVEEMQSRYNIFRNARCRTLKEYNNKEGQTEKLPWWVIVLDEYADLTSEPESKKKIEGYLKRLAQKARAAGIHVIIATQKPSGEVISTNLRSNLPAQLALRVKSSTESRVIMDEGGAESLNGMGDAFLKSESKLIRLQCAKYS